MSIFRKPEETEPIQLEGNDLVVPQQEEPKKEKKKLPKPEWF